MRIFSLPLAALFCSVMVAAVGAQTPIDRHALVSRHNIDWPSLEGRIPLGNGNFAFNADGTGLETVAGNTMCHWCWHDFPLPPGVTPSDIKPWATPDHGHLTGTGDTTKPPDAIFHWERLNPQPLNLGRLGFIDAEGVRLRRSEVRIDSRQLNLWTGLLTTHFTYRGEPVSVETCVDPKSDTVAVRVVSPLLRDRRLQIMLDFPAPARGNADWVGDFSQVEGHQTDIVRRTGNGLELSRTIDDARYHVDLAGSGFDVNQAPATRLEIVRARYGAENIGWADVTAKVVALLHEGGITVTASDALGGTNPSLGLRQHLEVTYRLDGREETRLFPEGDTWNLGAGPSLHRLILAPKIGTETLEVTCRYQLQPNPEPLPEVARVEAACADSWPAFWKSGGALDLSGSKDPRWMELERRVVLSQYELAVQSAGDNPPAEVGLTGQDPWEGKWHFEMIWWHLAHYALWDRWSMAEKAVGIYQRITPVARAIAQNFDYPGLMWPKSTGPNGYNDGWPMEMSLLWKEPHPIFFATLDYRLHPTDATLAKWKDIVFSTADFMTGYATRDTATGQYDLFPVMGAAETLIPHHRNTVFEIGYWQAALEMAQQWRLRLGLKREPHWDDLANHLAPLPTKDGLYIYSEDRPETFVQRSVDHLDMIGIAGMLPPFQGLDPATAHRTVEEVARDWRWEKLWGWDFPWLAMAAARVGEPHLAIDALLNPAKKNRYDERGLCLRGASSPYLPGNGGLLYAVAMMAAGWDGAPDRPAPGFPDDGSWSVQWEDLKRAP